MNKDYALSILKRFYYARMRSGAFIDSLKRHGEKTVSFSCILHDYVLR